MATTSKGCLSPSAKLSISTVVVKATFNLLLQPDHMKWSRLCASPHHLSDVQLEDVQAHRA